ncbi:50S ribosomal protein L17 [Elusimicrobiota bacterium]
MTLRDKRNIKKMTFNLIKRGRISISVPLAKEVKKKTEKFITRAKKDNAANRRHVAKYLPAEAVEKLFTQIGPANKGKKGGYTRLLRIGPRKGDGCERCLLEIINV